MWHQRTRIPTGLESVELLGIFWLLSWNGGLVDEASSCPGVVPNVFGLLAFAAVREYITVV